MSNTDLKFEKQCADALKVELMPAFGCTEPIAIALAAARATQLLGKTPQRVSVACSGNIIKNVKGVVVPSTGNLVGIPAAAAVGITGGDPDLGLEVLKNVSEADILAARKMIDANVICVQKLDTEEKLHLIVEMRCDDDHVLVEIMHTHTNIVREEKNGKILFSALPVRDEENTDDELSGLTLADLYETASKGDLEPVRELLEKQIKYNTAISAEGLKKDYGAHIGRTILSQVRNCV